MLAARLDGPRGERRGQTSAGCPLGSTTCHETSFTSPQHRVRCQRETRTVIKGGAAAESLTVEPESQTSGDRASSAQRQTWISLPFKTVPIHIAVDMVSQTHGAGASQEKASRTS